MWTDADPWEFSFAQNTGDLFFDLFYFMMPLNNPNKKNYIEMCFIN